MKTDPRRHAPATARNRDPILAVLRPLLPTRGLVLEIASGSGEHITYFARNTDPGLEFQPSDPDPAARSSIDAWVAELGLANVRPALTLDAAAAHWPIAAAEVVICINMIHISPWAATVGLMQGAARTLPSGAPLYIYGPYRRDGRHTSASNESFDQELRAQDPAWGVRDLEAVVTLAESNGFGPPAIESMPANNLSVTFRKQ